MKGLKMIVLLLFRLQISFVIIGVAWECVPRSKPFSVKDLTFPKIPKILARRGLLDYGR